MCDIPQTRVTVLISGEGSNLQALIDASQSRLKYIHIVRVISNRLGANGLNRAKAAGIPIKYHNLIAGKYYLKAENDQEKKKQGREKYDADLADIVLADKPDIVVCAGFLQILTPYFLDPMKKQNIPVINLHPALYGKYDGENAIRRAYNDFIDGKLENNRTGIMIHYVIKEVDRGEPVIEKEVECHKSESFERLEERMHEEEHKLIVEGVAIAISELWKKRSA
ncbi:Phosphoribosylglycinamide formyltransferase [Erysiphe necator]|uniref:Phosphoribosylglycinamide formyltransferase n=1 Tax=Uncinula necator TaxID=52586 RepID=A0A0B1PCN9_UNCNE|nr:Phosphoribosylglycinamide formyltransferase [Erysiphe necator]KHJ36452.1 putative phosphoribosylglycinamide formyltransferase [Erysiphe necator]